MERFLPLQENGPICGFSGDYRWLSNFWECNVSLECYDFRSVESAYQFAKLPLELRSEYAEWYMSSTPGQAKRKGRELPLRGDWDFYKVPTMRGLVSEKFSRDERLFYSLMGTGNRGIYEENTWGDTFWGVIRDKQGRLKGENMLGKLIMDVRAELRSLAS